MTDRPLILEGTDARLAGAATGGRHLHHHWHSTDHGYAAARWRTW